MAAECALFVPDRLSFERAIERRMEAWGIDGTAVGLVDLNGFAELLARSGQAYADELLREVFTRLAGMFPDGYVIGRIGTDTFGVIGAPADITHMRLEEVKRLPFNVRGDDIMVSVSVSIALASECELGGHSVLLAAVLAMKSAKEQGYGHHAYYSREMGHMARQRSELMSMLYAAVEAREMFLVYQPQVALATGRVVGLEALLRWRPSNGEWVSPEVFLPLAEQSGLAVKIGYQVITMAMNTGQRLRAEGFDGLRMAVNVSIPQFRDAAFVATVQQAIEDSKCNPEELELEITESVAGLGEPCLMQVLHAIRGLGVGVAIDDFGTGYSSLAYINKLPADRLKIDRSFVNALGTAGTMGAESCIVRTIIGMGHTLGMQVLAEGVETELQACALKDFGCDEVQGYYFAKPMAEPDLKIWLKDRM